jgi:hypothetical protein
MVAARIVAPHTKLPTMRVAYHRPGGGHGVADSNEDDLYAAMDWLLARQQRSRKNSVAAT